MSKNFKPFLARIASCALAAVMVFSLAAVPGIAAENLTITIKNAEGLAAMKEDQFKVYQLFTGTVSVPDEPASDPDSGTYKNMWEAEHWYDTVLSGIEWGSSVDGSALQSALQGIDAEEQTWAKNGGAANVFASVDSASSVAKILEGKSHAFMQSFASWLMSGGYLTAMSKDSDYTETLTPDGANHANDQLVYKVNEPGYYLFAENAEDGTLDVISEFILAALGDQTIQLKGDVPDLEKKIKGSTSGSDFGELAEVGETVRFELTGTLPENFDDYDTYNYKFFDTLSEGLTFADDVLVTVVQDDKTYTISADEYQATHADNAGKTEVTIDFGDIKNGHEGTPGLDYDSYQPDGGEQAGTLTVAANCVIHIEYSAELNDKAVVGAGTDGRGNPNVVKLTYSNNPDSAHTESTHDTPEEETYVYTFGLDIKKVGDDAAHQSGLEGAGFILKKGGQIAKFEDKEGKKALASWENMDSFNAAYQTYKSAKEALAKAGSADKEEKQGELDTALAGLSSWVFTSTAEGGAFPDITDLDKGSYTLSEVVTPDGYETAKDITISIDATLNADTGRLESVTYTTSSGSNTGKQYTNAVDTQTVFQTGLIPDTITNIQAPFLPHTGGIGAALVIAVFAAGFAVCAVALRKASRKGEAEE